MSKPIGIFIHKWEDIQDDPKLGLRELLLWKRKRKEVLTPEPDSTPQCVRVRALDDKIIYKLWRCTGLTCSTQGGLERGLQHKTLVCYVAQESSGEESNMESEKKITTEKEVQVTVKEKLEEIDLGTDPQKSRPISISSKLVEEEKVELIL